MHMHTRANHRWYHMMRFEMPRRTATRLHAKNLVLSRLTTLVASTSRIVATPPGTLRIGTRNPATGGPAVMSQGESDHRGPSSWRFTSVLLHVLCVLIGFLTAAVFYQSYGPESSTGAQWTSVRFSSADTPSTPLGTPQQQQQQLQQEVVTIRSVSQQLQQHNQVQAQQRQKTDATHYAAVQQQTDSIKAVGREIAEQHTQLLQTITELRNALVKPQTGSAAGAAAAAAAGGQTTGVICTVLRNEANYLSEWVAFHLLMGATKIVIYDDNSTDALQAAIAPYADAVNIIRLQDVPGVPGDAQVHRVGSRQDWAFDHCKRNYASNSSTGWFGIWDVDEFVFPCMPPTTQGNMLWSAWASSVKPGSDAHELRCNRFGQNDEDLPQADGELVLLRNIKRAPDALQEPTANPLAEAGTHSGCDQCGCCQSTSTKTIYDITKFKSTKEAADKAQANLNSFYENVATTPDAKRYYTMIQDTLIWHHLPNLLDLLRAKGVEVNL